MSSFEDKVKTSSIISDLCRVIIFLSLDNYTDIIAISINKDKDVILNEVLSIIEHVWLTEDWLLKALLGYRLSKINMFIISTY